MFDIIIGKIEELIMGMFMGLCTICALSKSAFLVGCVSGALCCLHRHMSQTQHEQATHKNLHHFAPPSHAMFQWECKMMNLVVPLLLGLYYSHLLQAGEGANFRCTILRVFQSAPLTRETRF